MNPFATATELLADLRAGHVTSSELTEMYIGRIEKHDQRLRVTEPVAALTRIASRGYRSDLARPAALAGRHSRTRRNS